MKNENPLIFRSIVTYKQVFFLLLAIFFFFLNVKISRADYMTSAQCNAQGGSCNWVSNNCSSDETLVGLCQGGIFSQGACCKKTSVDTSGADPDPIGAGIGAGGVLQDPNTGLGGPMGGTVTPGTSGIPTTSSTSSSSSGNTGGLVPCSNCTLCHLVIGFKRIYEFFLKLLFVATMLALTVSGVFYMVSSGSKTLTEMAKKALTYSLTAFVIGMGAWILINTVMSALGYQHPYGGRWWEFTCDTTQSAGPVSSGRTITGSGNLTGKGCEGVAQNARAMEGWNYSQSNRMSDGSADCSSMVSRSYVAAGCSNPGSTSSEMYSRAQVIDNSNSLRAGDAIVYSGHVVMCLDNGCNNVMSANSKNGIYSRNSSYDFQQSDARVIRASDYCSDC